MNVRHEATPARWELIRALGAAITTAPPANEALRAALGLAAETRAEHTEAFVLGLPPFAAIHLGPEGKLGGDGLDRVAGFWRALRLTPPPDADHLGVLLLFAAQLGWAGDRAQDERRRARLEHARETLLREHVLSWAPGYLTALERAGVPAAADWARLARRVLTSEAAALCPTDTFPGALRNAPPPLAVGDRDELLDTVLAPVRSGVVLTQADIAAAADRIGLGFRRGERRFALKALLEQDPRGMLRWLHATASGWAADHRESLPGQDAIAAWWSARARACATTLAELVEEPAGVG